MSTTCLIIWCHHHELAALWPVTQIRCTTLHGRLQMLAFLCIMFYRRCCGSRSGHMITVAAASVTPDVNISVTDVNISATDVNIIRTGRIRSWDRGKPTNQQVRHRDATESWVEIEIISAQTRSITQSPTSPNFILAFLTSAPSTSKPTMYWIWSRYTTLTSLLWRKHGMRTLRVRSIKQLRSFGPNIIETARLLPLEQTQTGVRGRRCHQGQLSTKSQKFRASVLLDYRQMRIYCRSYYLQIWIWTSVTDIFHGIHIIHWVPHHILVSSYHHGWHQHLSGTRCRSRHCKAARVIRHGTVCDETEIKYLCLWVLLKAERIVHLVKKKINLSIILNQQSSA